MLPLILLSALGCATGLLPSRHPASRPKFAHRLATRSTPASTTTVANAVDPVCVYEQIPIEATATGPPAQEITIADLTPYLKEFIARSGLRNGCINVISLHTTTGITINEWESRLVHDMRSWLLKLAPPDDRSAIGTNKGIRYDHNDIDMRPDSDDERDRCLENGWDIDEPQELQRWRDQEPINAHSHLASMLLGSSETIPVVEGRMALGQWQSVMLVDTDGPRDRRVGVQSMGTR